MSLVKTEIRASSKKRKIEEENELDNALLTFPLAENMFPDSQPSGSNSQAVAAEIFTLTLVEPEPEKNEALFVWKKLELHSVTDLLHKCEKTMYVMQKGIESSALGCSKSAAGMII